MKRISEIARIKERMNYEHRCLHHGRKWQCGPCQAEQELEDYKYRSHRQYYYSRYPAELAKTMLLTYELKRKLENETKNTH